MDLNNPEIMRLMPGLSSHWAAKQQISWVIAPGPGGFSSLSFDQAVPYYSQRHLADLNAIYICIDKIVPNFLDVI